MTTGKAGEVCFTVRAHPRSKRSAIEGVRDGSLRVAVRAAPERGAANEEIVRLVAEALGVPRGAVRIVRGAGSRDKTLAARGVTEDEVRARLAGSDR